MEFWNSNLLYYALYVNDTPVAVLLIFFNLVFAYAITSCLITVSTYVFNSSEISYFIFVISPDSQVTVRVKPGLISVATFAVSPSFNVAAGVVVYLT